MALIVKHVFQSGKTNGPDATQIQPSNWNDGHTFAGGAAGQVLTRDPTDATYGAKWAPAARPGGAAGNFLICDPTDATYGAKWDGGVYAAYAPVWSSLGSAPALGNGTLAGTWARSGKLVRFGVRLGIGSTTGLGTSAWKFTLPTPAESAGSLSLSIVGVGVDSSAGSIPYVAIGTGFLQSALSIAAGEFLVWSFNAAGNIIGAAAPFAWASGDTLDLAGSYFSA
jgi:hypothetical protein